MEQSVRPGSNCLLIGFQIFTMLGNKMKFEDFDSVLVKTLENGDLGQHSSELAVLLSVT